MRVDGKTAPMIRKNSPQLNAGLNAPIAKRAEGSKRRKALPWRDLQNRKFANEATSPEEIAKFDHAVEFFKNKPMDRLNKSPLTFGSYNAGPGRIAQLRKLAEKQGLNPNVRFNNVELLAAEKVGRETVQCASNS